MSAFRKHLEDVHDKLNHPQASAMMEEKKATKSLEHTIMENMMVAPTSGPGKKAAKKLYKQEDAAGASAAGGKKKKIAEETFAGYLNDYFGGELNESTSEDAIIEAVQHLFEMEATIAEYLEGDADSTSDEVYEAIDDYLYAYFGDELSEDMSDELISEALFDLVETAESARITLED